MTTAMFPIPLTTAQLDTSNINRSRSWSHRVPFC